MITARERILRTAGSLFYKEGIRLIGIDTIVEQAGVAKMTLYRHFSSKDELILAYLAECDRLFWQWFEFALASSAGQLTVLFEALIDNCVRPDYLGCPFLKAAAEFPELNHPIHQAALANKQAVQNRLVQIAQDAGATKPQDLAAQLSLLLDGAYASVQIFGTLLLVEQAKKAAKILIETSIQ